MLVPERVVEKWYYKDHFIYKNFAYIFQNPLWSNKIPKGFSVCPYFWMSMLVGFLLIRCLLVPCLLGFGKIISIGGRPLSYIDRKLAKLFGYIKPLDDIMNDNYRSGMGTLSLIVLIVMPIALCGIIYGVSSLLYRVTISLYMSYIDTYYRREIMFWEVVALFCLVLISGIYYLIRRNEDKVCNVKIYPLIWSAIILITSAVLYTEKYHAIGILTINTSKIAWGLLVKCYHEIVHGLYIGLIFVGAMLKIAFMYSWIYIASIIAFGIFMYMMGKLMDYLDRYYLKKEKDRVSLNPVQYQEYLVNKSSLLYFLSSIISSYIEYNYEETPSSITDTNLSHFDWESNKYLKNYSRYKYSMIPTIQSSFSHSWWYSLVSSKFNIPDQLAKMTSREFRKISGSYGKRSYQYFIESLINNGYSDLAEELKSSIKSFWKIVKDETSMNVIINDDSKAIADMIKYELAKIDSMNKKKEEKTAARKRRDQLCSLFTSSISNVFVKIGRGFRFSFSLIFKPIVFIWQIICWIWIAIRSKKKNWCPYITFKNNGDKSEYEKEDNQPKG